MIYWIKREGRWVTVFIAQRKPEPEEYIIEGQIFNMRRNLSNKRIRLCWKNLLKYKVNIFTDYDFYLSKEEEGFFGPFEVFWN